MIDAARIKYIFIDCLLKHPEDGDIENGTQYIEIDGVHCRVAFSPEKINSYKQEIKECLDQLNDEFKKPFGHSFMCVPFHNDESQWGEQIDGDRLMMLGMAMGFVKYVFPREVWYMLPGSVPYYTMPEEPVEISYSKWSNDNVKDKEK